jgi:ABC-type branched-subunit amino acid transport system ATPase component
LETPGQHGAISLERQSLIGSRSNSHDVGQAWRNIGLAEAVISKGDHPTSGVNRRCSEAGRLRLEDVVELFRPLKERLHVPAWQMSGGQQQMVALGRALLTNPSLLLCDEISLGLAPLVIKEIYLQLERVVASGTTLIVVEQDIKQAMAVADRVYCLREGQMVLEGRPGDLSREQITAAYFGL